MLLHGSELSIKGTCADPMLLWYMFSEKFGQETDIESFPLGASGTPQSIDREDIHLRSA
jgi:hypothetical protein